MSKNLWAALLLGLFAGCHPIGPSKINSWDQLQASQQRAQLVEHAQWYSHMREFAVDRRRFSDDCSGYVGVVLYQSGIDVFRGATELQMRGNGVKLLLEFVSKYGTLYRNDPRPGDLIFFSNTYDRNRDRKSNDSLTHVGIVERVDEDDTVVFLHYLNGKVRRYAMNRRFPFLIENPEGKVINSYLRRRRRSDPPGSHYLTAGLFAGYGSLVSDPLTTLARSSRSEAQ